MTVEDKIYQHMREHGSINSREALSLYGCIQLKPIIQELNKKGVKTVSRRVRVDCENGMQTHVLQYSLEE